MHNGTQCCTSVLLRVCLYGEGGLTPAGLHKVTLLCPQHSSTGHVVLWGVVASRSSIHGVVSAAATHMPHLHGYMTPCAWTA